MRRSEFVRRMANRAEVIELLKRGNPYRDASTGKYTTGGGGGAGPGAGGGGMTREQGVSRHSGNLLAVRAIQSQIGPGTPLGKDLTPAVRVRTKRTLQQLERSENSLRLAYRDFLGSDDAKDRAFGQSALSNYKNKSDMYFQALPLAVRRGLTREGFKLVVPEKSA